LQPVTAAVPAANTGYTVKPPEEFRAPPGGVREGGVGKTSCELVPSERSNSRVAGDTEFDEKCSRIPLEYLRELFGPGVEKALAKIEAERKKAAADKKSELIDIPIARNWQQLLGPYLQDPGTLERPPRKQQR
jgi:hypothetical protein